MTLMASPGDASAEGTEPAPASNARFERLWPTVRGAVTSHCERSGLGREDCEDVVQCIALRVWSGLPGYREEAAFSTWVMAIARNEVIRFLGSPAERYRRSVLSVDDDSGLASVVELARMAAPCGEDKEIDLIGRAVAAGQLTEREGLCLALRAQSDAAWATLARRLEVTPTAARALHYRAVGKLCVYVLCFRIDLCGGEERVRASFSRLAADPACPLSAREAQVFRQRVFLGDTALVGRGSQDALRSACRTVARNLFPMRPAAPPVPSAPDPRAGGPAFLG